MGELKQHGTPLAGLIVIGNAVHADQRGRFQRVFCSTWASERGLDFRVVQANHSETFGRGTVRGLHYQRPPHSETKLVRCLKGRVFDVVVDLRAESPTFLRWYGVELAGESPCALLVPPGCAHGFQVLGDVAEMLYLHDAAWAPAHEGGIRHDDPRVGIAWPVPARNLSPRDLAHPLIGSDFEGVSP